MSDWIKVPYPFYQETVDAGWDADCDGIPRIRSWVPGTTYVQHNEYDYDAYADGMGFMLLKEIANKKLPKPYQERVFFIRQWETPSGRVFGKTKLRVTTRATFTKLQKGFRHSYILDPQERAA